MSPKAHLHIREAPLLRTLQQTEGVFQGSPHLTCKIKTAEMEVWQAWSEICQRGSYAPKAAVTPLKQCTSRIRISPGDSGWEKEAGRSGGRDASQRKSLSGGAGSHRPEELSRQCQGGPHVDCGCSVIHPCCLPFKPEPRRLTWGWGQCVSGARSFFSQCEHTGHVFVSSFQYYLGIFCFFVLFAIVVV